MPGTDEVKKDFCLLLKFCWPAGRNVLTKKADSKRVPLALAKAETETHSLLETLIKYTEYNWQVCGDFKIIALILVFSWVILNTAAL